ncbi:hypothetical protein LCGC14_0319630 [marine sediment metagenome]|uniref:ASCH domain-containing protein n=1 Tax=marine sediment metagenome TaxID=412755 RepID=A0A0F9TJH3_9ZZZZ
MRRMSFSLTERQFLDGTKNVTRRTGWRGLQKGDRFMAVRKCMGLKKGEKQVVLGECVVLGARRERLSEITKHDCIREGFPDLTPDEFVDMFNRHMRCGPNARITRIEFRRVESHRYV